MFLLSFGSFCQSMHQCHLLRKVASWSWFISISHRHVLDGAIIADVPSPTMARKVLDQSPAVENLLSSISFYRAKSYARIWLAWNLFAVVLDWSGVNVVLNFARLCFLVGLTCARLSTRTTCINSISNLRVSK